MPAASMKTIVHLQGRHGPAGKLWLEGSRDGRRFMVLQRKDGSWTLYERTGVLELVAEARSDAPPPRQPSRPAPRKVRRELVRLGLVEAGDAVMEAGQ